jgi:ABC-type uncharacterized transport system permease subunit
MTDRTLLWLAQAFYMVSVLLTVRRLRAGGATDLLHRVNFLAMVGGFLMHTGFLYMRGQLLHRCPLTNLFESQAFVAWAAVLFYLLIGSAYRVSFLGAFTAPLVLAICLLALILPIDVAHAEPLKRSPWIEFHAAIAIVAFGAFALALVASGMYLLQERQLKTRRLTPSFLLMPSIDQLEKINFRLLVMGIAMYSAGMLGGVISYRIVGQWSAPKIIWAWTVWLVYAGLVTAQLLRLARGRKVALATIALFVLTLVGYWGVGFLPK